MIILILPHAVQIKHLPHFLQKLSFHQPHRYIFIIAYNRRYLLLGVCLEPVIIKWLEVDITA